MSGPRAETRPATPRPRRARDPHSPGTAGSGPPPPRPPRRPPRPARQLAPMSARRLVIRNGVTLLALLALFLFLNVTVLSQIQHAVAQVELRSQFTEQLAEGTAPVSEGDFEDVLLTDGDPVARIEIPAIGVDELVVEGTSATVLTKGPGHRRDTNLPGQSGVSVIMGRSAAYGGPFARLQQLEPGDQISVVTGQGEHIYEVIGVRYAGDTAPAAVTAGHGRLILETARGAPFVPSGIVRVDANLVSEVQTPGQRDTLYRSLSPEQKEMAGDTRTVWALVFALQFLIVAEIGAAWSLRRMGRAKTWLVFAPVILLAGLLVADQLTRMLPNLM
ncbi:sortase [Brooklawnia cerclae]